MFPRIKELRKEKGYSQKQVAEKLGIARGVYQRYETGIRKVPAVVLVGLSEIYGTSCDYILELTDTRRKYSK